MARAKVKPKSQLAPRRTTKTLVASPYSSGGFDQVERIFDTAERMHRHRQIDAGQKAAADRFTWAHETVPGGLRCALASSDTPHRAPGPREPALVALKAAEMLAQARDRLGQLDMHLLTVILIQGLSVHAAARRLCRARGQATARDCDYLGRRFRDALSELAALWFGSRRRSLRVFAPVDSRPAMGEAGVVPAEAICSVQASARGVR